MHVITAPQPTLADQLAKLASDLHPDCPICMKRVEHFELTDSSKMLRPPDRFISVIIECHQLRFTAEVAHPEFALQPNSGRRLLEALRDRLDRLRKAMDEHGTKPAPDAVRQ